MNGLLIAGFVLIDQLSKAHFQYHFKLGDSIPVIPRILHLTYHHNTGAAFGLFEGETSILTVVSLVFIVWATLYLFWTKHGSIHRLALHLVLAGAVGNFIDRLRLGYVVDFIDFRVWPIFNIADSCITVGVLWIVWNSVMGKPRG